MQDSLPQNIIPIPVQTDRHSRASVPAQLENLTMKEAFRGSTGRAIESDLAIYTGWTMMTLVPGA